MVSKYEGFRISANEEILLREIVEITKKNKSEIIKETISQNLEGLKILGSQEKLYSIDKAEQILKS